MLQAEHFSTRHGLLGVRHLVRAILGLLGRKLFLDALLAERLFLKHHDGLWEVTLAQIHLDCISEERHAARALLTRCTSASTHFANGVRH